MSEYFRAATNCDVEIAKTSPLPVDTFEVKRQQFIHEKLVSQAVQTQLLLNRNNNNQQQVIRSTVQDPLDKFPGIINTGGSVAPTYHSPAGSRHTKMMNYSANEISRNLNTSDDGFRSSSSNTKNATLQDMQNTSDISFDKDHYSNQLQDDPTTRRKGPHALKRELQARIDKVEEEAQKKMKAVLELEETERILQQKRNHVEATRQERRAAVEAGAAETEEVLKREAVKKAATEQYEEVLMSPLSSGWARKKVHPVDVLHHRIASEIRRELEEFEHRQVRTFLTTRLRNGGGQHNNNNNSPSPSGGSPNHQ